MATYGLRNSEIVGLTLDDVDWRGRILQVQQFKTSSALTLPLTHGRKVKIFSRPTSLYCATSCNRNGKQKSALVEPQCFPPLRLST